MRVPIYFPIHFLGIFLLFMSLGAMCVYCRNGGTKEDNPSRKFLASMHGLGLLLTIIGGMGLMKAFAVSANGMPAWIIVKLCIWLFLGMASMLVYKFPKRATLFFFLFCFCGCLAGLAAWFKSLDVFLTFFRI